MRSSQHSSTNCSAVRRASKASVVKGTVIRIANDFVTIDVGLKSEGRVALREFANGGTGAPEVKEGDVVDIFVDRMENKEGEAVLSRDKARREEAWTLLEKAFNDQERVMGTIFGRVKGGFTVDLSAAPWPSCRAARSTSARCAMSAR